MGDQVDYTALLNQFMLQRMPYISIADALDDLYHSFLYSTGLTSEQIAPFDFALLKARPGGTESFRWILGYNHVKFDHILKNKDVFTRHVGLICSNMRDEPLTRHYHAVLKNPDQYDSIEFLTAVFHLTFRFIIPADVFNFGLIHKEHKRTKAPFYRAELCLTEDYGIGNIPRLRIEQNPPVPQVTREFYESQMHLFTPFLHEWMCTIQGLDLSSKTYDYTHYLYIPVYDSFIPTQRALRGYLGVFCASSSIREVALEFFNNKRHIHFKNINEAYKKGIHNYIVDSYKEYAQSSDPVKYWADSVHRLHPWGMIRINTDGNVQRSELFWIDGRNCKLSIERLLRRKTAASYVDDCLLDTYRDKVLSLHISPKIVSKTQLSIQLPFLKQRLREVVQLLDDLLRTRFISMERERIKQATRKAAVAAVMSRNMSHNLGSHVLARLCTSGNLFERIGTNAPRKVSTLNAFLRTRMDFLADVSTSTPTVTTPLRLYRDTMGYFKPIYVDQEEVRWQELLFDYISGIEDLKSANIEVRFLKDGHEISLDTTGIDPLFACPNGLLGTHALYVIVENIIRNCAKHAFRQERHSKLVISFEFNDCKVDENLIEVCVYNNLGDANVTFEARGLKLPLIDYLNRKIGDSILDETGNLRGVAWGLLEMKICAAYLRKIPPERLDEAYGPPLLEAVPVGENLGYRFYLKRPNKILIVDANSRLSDEYRNGRFNDRQFQVVNLDEFRKQLNSNIEHSFLILIDPDIPLLDLVRNNQEALPPRILTTNESASDFVSIDFYELRKSLEAASDTTLALTNRIWHYWVNPSAKEISLFIRPEEKKIALKWQSNGHSCASIDPGEIKNLDTRRKYIIFDRHGLIRKEHNDLLNRKIAEGSILYYEPIKYTHPTNIIINNLANDQGQRQKTSLELLETGLVKVILLDERIQKSAEEIIEYGQTLREILQLMNIWIPPRETSDLDNALFSFKRLNIWLNKQLPDTRFLAVHLGVLEKLFKANVDAMGKKIRRIEREFPDLNVIIISGRGVPDTVRILRTRFLQYSPVARYVLEERSKFHLTRILFAARRPLS